MKIKKLKSKIGFLSLTFDFTIGSTQYKGGHFLSSS